MRDLLSIASEQSAEGLAARPMATRIGSISPRDRVAADELADADITT
jgi:hypothetical protein